VGNALRPPGPPIRDQRGTPDAAAGDSGALRAALFGGHVVAFSDWEDASVATFATFCHLATPEGVFDLSGNEAEWTSSLFRPYPYDAADGREDPNFPGERVTRGGDHVFDVAPDQLTGIFRDGFSRDPSRGHRHIGFRCAKDVG
jgi:formylglycine-generating enzyme required for sulfatase activity